MTWLNDKDQIWIQNRLVELNEILTGAIEAAKSGNWPETLRQIERAFAKKAQVLDRMPPIPLNAGFVLFNSLYFDMKQVDQVIWRVNGRYWSFDPNSRQSAENQLWILLWILRMLLARNRFSAECKALLQKIINEIQAVHDDLNSGSAVSRLRIIRLLRKVRTYKLDFWRRLLTDVDLSRIYDNLFFLDDFLEAAVEAMLSLSGEEGPNWQNLISGKLRGAKEAKERLEQYWESLPAD
jgi:hypothetical protein